MAIVHHCDSHRHLAWSPIPEPRQTGSPGGCYKAGEVLRKSTRGSYGKRVSRTTQKTAHPLNEERVTQWMRLCVGAPHEWLNGCKRRNG